MKNTHILNMTVLAGSLLLANAATAAPSFINGLALPGAMGDTFGTVVNDGRLGFFSDIYYNPGTNEWWGLSDRGPGGGFISYDTRVQRFTLDVDMNTGAISNFQVAETIKFYNGGSSLNGLAPSTTSLLGNSFDPEGIVINPNNGNFLVSDEYGPSVYEIDRHTGNVLRTFETPANLVPRNASTQIPNYAGDTNNTAGKRTNRGFEGLAISPDGQYAYAMLQSAMLDEGGGNGRVNRIVKFDMNTGEAVAQFAYEMKRNGQGQGISALVAINDHEFLVLERNNRGVGIGAELATADKEVYRIDLTGATDVSNIDLDSGASFTRVSKTGPFLDLDANTLSELGNRSPEKWEGLAVGPRLNDGSYLLLSGTDNDYSVTQNSNGQQFDVYLRFSDADPYASSIQCPLGQTTGCFLTSNTNVYASLTSDYSLLPGVLHAYKVSAEELGNYVTPVPVPPAALLFVSGLGVLAARLRRKKSA